MNNLKLNELNEEIKTVIFRLHNASKNNHWMLINDLSKYLSKLLKDRNFYIKNYKNNNNKL